MVKVLFAFWWGLGVGEVDAELDSRKNVWPAGYVLSSSRHKLVDKVGMGHEPVMNSDRRRRSFEKGFSSCCVREINSLIAMNWAPTGH